MKSIDIGDIKFINYELIKSWLNTEKQMTMERLRFCDITDRGSFHYLQGRLNAIDSLLRFLRQL